MFVAGVMVAAPDTKYIFYRKNNDRYKIKYPEKLCVRRVNFRNRLQHDGCYIQYDQDYKKAIAVNTNDEFMTGEALYKAGLFAESIGKTKEAVEYFQKIKDGYPKNGHAADVDKYLARLGVLN